MGGWRNGRMAEWGGQQGGMDPGGWGIFPSAIPIVHNTLKSLNNQPGVKRVEYPLEFKKALMWVCKEGVPILKSIKEKEALLSGVEALPLEGFATLENLPPGVFAGFDFMNSLDDGSVTTESTTERDDGSVTTSWSVATEDTILAEFGRVLDL